MASRNRSRLGLVLLPWLVAAPLVAQAPSASPLRLSFAEAVSRAADAAPSVAIAGLQQSAADARVRQARGALLPSLAFSSGWVNRTFNKHSLGIEFPNFGSFVHRGSSRTSQSH